MGEERQKEIASMLSELTVYWMHNPTMRLCQILGNFFPEDNYYVEDELVKYILKSCNKEGLTIPSDEILETMYKTYSEKYMLRKASKWKKNINEKIHQKKFKPMN